MLLLVVIENTKNVKEIIYVLEEIFNNLGYHVAWHHVSPEDFKIPNSRPRYYIVLERGSIISNPQSGMQLPCIHFQPNVSAYWEKMFKEISKGPRMPIAEMLLPLDSDYYKDHLIGIGELELGTHGETEWVGIHADAFAKIGSKRPDMSKIRMFCESNPSKLMGQWLGERPLRIREKAYYWSIEMRPTEEACVELSQGLDPSPPMKGCIGCFAASSIPWLVRSQRVISGREQLAIQGLSLRSMMTGAADTFLSNLAGNAMSAPCVMAAFSSAMRGAMRS